MTENSTLRIKALDWPFLLLLILLFLPATVLYTSTSLEPTLTLRQFGLALGLFIFSIVFFKQKIELELSSYLVKYVFLSSLSLLLLIPSFWVALNVGEALNELVKSVLSIASIFFAALIFKHNPKRITWVSRAIVLLAILHSSISFLQYYNLYFTALEPRTGLAPFGIMTNRNLLGSALALMLPFCVYIILTDTKLWRYIAGTAVGGILWGIFFSMTRSVWLSLVLATLLGSICLFYYRKNIPLIFVKNWFRAIGLLGILSVCLFFWLLKGNHPQGPFKEVQTRLLQITNPQANPVENSNSIEQRKALWSTTLNMIQAHPIVGVGAGNWRLNAAKHGIFHKWESTNERFVPLRPHNMYLQVWSERGFLGLLMFLATWSIVFMAIFKSFRQVETKNKTLLLCLTIGLFFFLFDGLFSFSNERIAHTFLVSVMVGIVFAIVPQSSDKKALLPNGQKTLIISALLFATLVSFGKYAVDKTSFRINAANAQGDFEKTIQIAQNQPLFLLPSLNSSADPIAFYIANAYFSNEELSLALQYIEKAKKQAPYHPRVLNNAAYFYFKNGQAHKAMKLYEQVLSLEPNFKNAMLGLMELYYKRGEYQKSYNLLLRSKLENAPEYQQFRLNLEKRLQH